MVGMNTRTGQRNVNYTPKLKAQEAMGFNDGSFRRLDIDFKPAQVGSSADAYYTPNTSGPTYNPNSQYAGPSSGTPNMSQVYDMQRQERNDMVGIANDWMNRGQTYSAGQNAADRASRETIAQIQTPIHKASYSSESDQVNAAISQEWNDRQAGRGYLYDRQVSNAKEEDAFNSRMRSLEMSRASWEDQTKQTTLGAMPQTAPGYYHVNTGSPTLPKIELRYDPAYDTARAQTDQQIRIMNKQNEFDAAARNNAGYQADLERNARAAADQRADATQRQLSANQLYGSMFSSMTGMAGGQGSFARYW